jgi:hypothetical protein
LHGHRRSLFDISCAKRNCSGSSALQSFHLQPVKQNPRRKLSTGGLSTGTVMKNLAMPSDPVKLTADILLHPVTPITLPQRQRLCRAAQRLYGSDPTFGPRLNALYPLFGLRWTLIVLNEFLPDRWHRRVMAGATETWAVAKQRQLARAREYVSHLTAQEHQGLIINGQ